MGQLRGGRGIEYVDVWLGYGIHFGGFCFQWGYDYWGDVWGLAPTTQRRRHGRHRRLEATA